MKFQPLEKKIDYKFKNQDLLKVALTHRSYSNETAIDKTPNNERLEFLGDAVLELVVTKFLFFNYPDRAEGELTSFRAAIVRTESLAETALGMELGKFMLMSKGEEMSGGRERPYILANALEALIGAIYIDSNNDIDICNKFVQKYLTIKLSNVIENRTDIDAKSKLQEISQEKYRLTPNYKVLSESGPDHERVFTIEVFLGEKPYGEGNGRSKQSAEQEAAKNALKKFL